MMMKKITFLIFKKQVSFFTLNASRQKLKKIIKFCKNKFAFSNTLSNVFLGADLSFSSLMYVLSISVFSVSTVDRFRDKLVIWCCISCLSWFSFWMIWFSSCSVSCLLTIILVKNRPMKLFVTREITPCPCL